MKADCSKYHNEEAEVKNEVKQEVKNEDSIKSTTKLTKTIAGAKSSKLVEVGVQTEKISWIDRLDDEKELLVPLRLPKIFQQNTKEKGESDESIKHKAIEFVKEFGIVMMNDKKFYFNTKIATI